MQIVVFGANGGVGRHAARLAAAAGHQVLATARQVPDVLVGTGPRIGGSGPVQARAVDVRDFDRVREAIQGADAALWCVGVTKRSGAGVGREGLTHLVRASAETGLSRLITVSGAGITLPGDVKGTGARLLSGLTRRLAGDLYADKVAEHEVLAASDLSWTEVRGPRLVEREGTGRWRLTDEAPGLTAPAVAKADVGAAMVQLAATNEWARRSPFLVAG